MERVFDRWEIKSLNLVATFGLVLGIQTHKVAASGEQSQIFTGKSTKVIVACLPENEPTDVSINSESATAMGQTKPHDGHIAVAILRRETGEGYLPMYGTYQEDMEFIIEGSIEQARNEGRQITSIGINNGNILTPGKMAEHYQLDLFEITAEEAERKLLYACVTPIQWDPEFFKM